MLNRLKYLNLLLILPDDRILMRREIPRWGSPTNVPWTSTVERFMGESQSSLVEAVNILRDSFKINFPITGSSDSVSVRQLEPIFTLTGKEIVPVVARARSHLSFQAKVFEEFKASFFEKFLDEITKLSIYPKNGQFPIHTQTCIHVARALHERGIFS